MGAVTIKCQDCKQVFVHFTRCIANTTKKYCDGCLLKRARAYAKKVVKAASKGIAK